MRAAERRRPRPRGGACAAAVVAVAALHASPFAHAADLAAYDITNTDWNGLSSLATIAEHADIAFGQSNTIDLSDGDVDALLVVYPTGPLDVDGIAAWVSRGGALVVADDFGSSAPLAARFGLERVAPGEGVAVLAGSADLPVVDRVGRHALSASASALALNHPTGLRGASLPVFAFSDGTGVVYDMSLGQGTGIFLSDPSALTNLMLPLHGNAGFARDLLARVCPSGRRCRAVVVTADGAIAAPIPPEPGPTGLDAFEARVRRALERWRDRDIDPRALRVGSFIIAAGLLALLATVFPRQAPDWLRTSFRFRAPLPLNPFEFALRRLTRRGRPASYVGPAALLRDRFGALFYPALGLEPPSVDAPASAFEHAAERYVDRHEPSASAARRRSVARTLRQLGRVPPHPEAGLGRPMWVDAKDLLRWTTEVHALLEKMDLDERFRDQSRRPGPNLR